MSQNNKHFSNTISPNREYIKNHLEFLFSGMKEFDDGKIEISLLTKSETFNLSDIDNAVDLAVKWNNTGKSMYTVGSILSPDMEPHKRSGDKDFYGTSVLWCDIDDPIDPEGLKFLYDHCKPNAAVITARHPTRRVQLWWKLDQSLTDSETVREALMGVAQMLKGDTKVTNETSLMRIGGTINYPSESKLSKGRIVENTEFHLIHNNTVNIEQFLSAYPMTGYMDFEEKENAQPVLKSVSSLGFEENVVDGREKYMSDMIYAAILNLGGKLSRWPTPQEVYDDVWPVYSKKAIPRNGRTLDQDHRGSKAVQQKIVSKLRQINMGRIRNAPTLEILIANKKEKTNHKESSENKEQHKNVMSYIKFKDIHPSLKSTDFVQNLLGNNQFSVTYGESNCGKTFFMTDLSFHIAQGRGWRDRRVDRGGIIYAALEGSYGLKNRVSAYRLENNITEDIPFAMVASQINFLNPEGNIKEFVELINRAADDLGDVKMVVVDTLARAISGGNENEPNDMGMIVKNADMIRYATNSHVNFIHHSGKDKAKGSRGHSSLRAAVDTEIEISKEDGADYSTIRIVKQREMEMDDDMFFRLKKIIIGKNDYMEDVTSCIVQPISDEDITPTSDKNISLTPSQQFAYDAICNAISEVGKQVHVPDMGTIIAITYDQLNDRMAQMGWSKYDDEFKTKKATNNIRATLRRKNKICFNAGYIWLVKTQH